jgi:hypothetical protein
MTVSQIADLGDSLLQRHQPDKKLANLALDGLFKPKIRLPFTTGEQGEDLPVSFGLGCGRYANGLYGLSSTASGQACALRIDAIHNVVIAIGTNCSHRRARDAILHEVYAKTVSRYCAMPADLGAIPLKDLAGEYQLSTTNRWLVTNDGMRLLISYSNEQPGGDRRRNAVELVLDAKHRLKPSNPNLLGQFVFLRDPRTATVYLAHGLTAAAKLTEPGS